MVYDHFYASVSIMQWAIENSDHSQACRKQIRARGLLSDVGYVAAPFNDHAL